MTRRAMLGFGVLLTVAGCGGGFGSSINVSPQRYQPVRPQAESAAIELPGAEGFAIHDKSSRQNPGPDGTASSDANARPDGTAFCAASASGGGSAGGEFVLGAALVNEATAPLTASVTCDIEYDYALNTTAGSGGHATAATIAFVLEAREQGTGRLLFQHPLAALSGYEDNVKRSDQQRVQFVATVSPAARWQIVLLGRTDAQAGEDGRADVSLRVDRCRMTVRALPAAATQSQPTS